MRVCIVTVYNSENYGSYWQAKALGDFLGSQGHGVAYLKRDMRGASHSYLELARRVASGVRHLDVGRVRASLERFRCFEAAQRGLPLVDSTDGFDACVIGSDTLWNLEQDYFDRHRRLYWGGSIDCSRKLTYAVSVGETSAERILADANLPRWTKNLHAVSVRDERSRTVLYKAASVDAQVVCDPTLLVDPEYYADHATTSTVDGPYVLLYHFGQIPPQLADQVRSLAERRSLRIVSLTGRVEGAVWMPALSMEEFLDVFAAASLVVTNTFHGVMFSLVLHRECVVNTSGKAKVKDAVERYALLPRVWHQGDDVRDIVARKTDWPRVDERISSMRARSRVYLSSALA